VEEPVLEARRQRLERLAQIVTRDYNLKLEHGDDAPIFSEKVIVKAPDLLTESELLEYQKGCTLHQCCHFVGDTFSADEKIPVDTKDYFCYFWHALEDARVENGLLAERPGIEKHLVAYRQAEFQKKRKGFTPTTPTSQPLPGRAGGEANKLAHELTQAFPSVPAQIRMGLYLAGRGYPLDWLAPNVQQLLEALASPIHRAATARTAEECADIFQKIYPLLERFAGPLKEPQEPRPDQDKEEEEVIEQRVSEEAKPKYLQLTDDEALRPDGVDPTLENVVRMSILSEFDNPGTAPWFEMGNYGKNIHTTAIRRDWQTIVIPPKGSDEEYEALAEAGKKELSFLLGKLTALLREKEYVRFEGKYSTGKLNRAKVWQFKAGEYQLFQKIVQPTHKSAAFSLLVDESASMNTEDKIAPARQATIVFAEVLNRLRVPFEIIGFSTEDYEAKTAMRLGLSPAHKYRFHRCSPLQHMLYKSFDEQYMYVKTRLLSMRPRFNNWDEEHLAFAFRRIVTRRELDKVIVILSDGQPNGDARNLVVAAKEMEKAGCKIIAVGLGENFVERVYRNYIVVENLSQLSFQLVKLLEQELLYT
jgi:hypothetical protein